MAKATWLLAGPGRNFPEIAQMRHRPAERGDAQQRKHLQHVQRRTRRIHGFFVLRHGLALFFPEYLTAG
jgi:hypothetical protein